MIDVRGIFDAADAAFKEAEKFDGSENFEMAVGIRTATRTILKSMSLYDLWVASRKPKGDDT